MCSPPIQDSWLQIQRRWIHSLTQRRDDEVEATCPFSVTTAISSAALIFIELFVITSNPFVLVYLTA